MIVVVEVEVGELCIIVFWPNDAVNVAGSLSTSSPSHSSVLLLRGDGGMGWWGFLHRLKVFSYEVNLSDQLNTKHIHDII